MRPKIGTSAPLLAQIVIPATLLNLANPLLVAPTDVSNMARNSFQGDSPSRGAFRHTPSQLPDKTRSPCRLVVTDVSSQPGAKALPGLTDRKSAQFMLAGDHRMILVGATHGFETTRTNRQARPLFAKESSTISRADPAVVRRFGSSSALW